MDLEFKKSLLSQKKGELHQIDQRIQELQTRLTKKRQINQKLMTVQLQTQQQQQQQQQLLLSTTQSGADEPSHNPFMNHHPHQQPNGLQFHHPASSSSNISSHQTNSHTPQLTPQYNTINTRQPVYSTSQLSSYGTNHTNGNTNINNNNNNNNPYGVITSNGMNGNHGDAYRFNSLRLGSVRQGVKHSLQNHMHHMQHKHYRPPAQFLTQRHFPTTHAVAPTAVGTPHNNHQLQQSTSSSQSSPSSSSAASSSCLSTSVSLNESMRHSPGLTSGGSTLKSAGGSKVISTLSGGTAAASANNNHTNHTSQHQIQVSQHSS